ncbi:MAG: hypothetical protein RLO52_30130 [Sandaracinaceae bacterium]
MSPDVTAIREAVGWRRAPELALLALRGEDARDALLHLCPSRLFLRDAQVKESLLLDDAGRPIADVLVCADDEDYLLLVEGLSPAALRAHVEAHLPPGCAPTLEDLGETHVVVSVHGPWAWEHVSKVLGDDMMALPYLNFFRVDHGLCVRAGKTGEFGYDLVVERDAADALMADIERHGEALDGEAVSLEAVSLCRFENGFFDPAHVPVGVTPLELQLGWRLDLERDWVGKAAIEARLADGVRRRLMYVRAETPLEGTLHLNGQAVGEVVRRARSESIDMEVASALIDVEIAHGGVVLDEGARVVAPPLVENRSLHVDPRRHVFATRDEIAFPPLSRFGARA